MKDIKKIIILENNEAIVSYTDKTVAIVNHKEAQLEIQRYINEHNFKTLQEFVDSIIMKTSERSDLERHFIDKFIDVKPGALRNQYKFLKRTYKKAKANKVTKLSLKKIEVDEYDGVHITYEYSFRDMGLNRKYLTVHGTADIVASILEEYILENNITDAKELVKRNIFDLSGETEDHLVKVTIPKMQEFIVKVWDKSLKNEEQVETEVAIEDIIDDIDTKFSKEVEEETNIDTMIESIDAGLLKELENMKEKEVISLDYYKDNNNYDVLVTYDNGTSEFVNLKQGNEILEKLINDGKDTNKLLHFHDVTNKNYIDKDTEVSYSEFRNNNTVEEIKEAKKEELKNKLISFKEKVKKSGVVQAALLVIGTGLCLFGISKLGNNNDKNVPATDVVAEDTTDEDEKQDEIKEEPKKLEYFNNGSYNKEVNDNSQEEPKIETAKVLNTTVSTPERKYEYSNVEYDSENDVAYSDLEVYNDLQKYYDEIRRKEAEENLKPITIDVQLTEPEQIDYSNIDNYNSNTTSEENTDSNQVIENEFEAVIANDVNEILGSDNNLYTVTIDNDKQDVNGNLNNQYMDLSTSNVTSVSNVSNEELANMIVEQLANSNENTVDPTYTK